MDKAILEKWIAEHAQAQGMQIYYELNPQVSSDNQLYEYPQDGHRVCIFHPSWMDGIFEICNYHGIALTKIGYKAIKQVDTSDKIELLRYMVETKSVLVRRGTRWFLSWDNQRVRADPVYALAWDGYLADRGPYMYVVTQSGKQAVMEAQRHG